MRAAEPFCGIEQMAPRVKILVEEENPRYGFGQRKRVLTTTTNEQIPVRHEMHGRSHLMAKMSSIVTGADASVWG
jgi:hypothetical protein